ncbi:MAG: response regulator [Nitrospinaceae bacterium]|nr:response regulator [Nitrospinaceae bacterium]
MKVRFWGVRGSLAKPGPTTVRYGGNTPCVQVTMDDGTENVFDCGTGIHGLGQQMMASGVSSHKGNLIITHTHWDHIQGFPFFVPLFVPGNEWNIYGPGGMGNQLNTTLSGQMSYSYFPIHLEALGATVRFSNLGEGFFDLGRARMFVRYTNHPSLTLAYRLESGGQTFVYIPDHEPHSLHPMNAPPGAKPIHHEDRSHLKFLEGADLLIHDAMYTMDEYPSKIGWGHSPFEKVVDYAIAGRVKRLAFFHHDPMRDDRAMDRLVKKAIKYAKGAERVPEIFAASDDMTIDLPEKAKVRKRSSVNNHPAEITSNDKYQKKKVLIVDDDRQMVRLLETTLEAEEGITFLHAYDGNEAVKVARKEHPDLILLDLELPGLHGLDVCRTLRTHKNPRINDVAIIVVTGKRFEEEDVLECFGAGATDYMTKEFATTGLRSRVRGWLMRTAYPVDRRRESRRLARGRRVDDRGRRSSDTN